MKLLEENDEFLREMPLPNRQPCPVERQCRFNYRHFLNDGRVYYLFQPELSVILRDVEGRFDDLIAQGLYGSFRFHCGSISGFVRCALKTSLRMARTLTS